MENKEFYKTSLLFSEQWETLKDDLSEGIVSNNDKEKLLTNYKFFVHFSDLLSEAGELLEIPLSSIKDMYRGTRSEISLTDYSRMSPLNDNKYYNRMNPPGKTYMYLCVLKEDRNRQDIVVKKNIVRTVLKEIRALYNEQVTICRFESTDANGNQKILDISGDTTIPKLENELYSYIKKKTNNAKDKEKLKLILAKLYFNVFSDEKIFKPIDTNENQIKQYEYAPFHVLADYVESLGYAGMKFNSTVRQNGANLVLFSPSDVKIIKESMEHINSSQYV